jgi:phenylacetate-CoA ligase
MYGRAFAQVMIDARLSRSRLDRLVHRRLQKVLVNAYQHVPYYRETMQAVGYDPQRDYRGPGDLVELPVTTKQILKEKGTAAFIKEGTIISRCFRDATSGSSGMPLVVYRSPYERALQIAKWLRVLFLNGYSVRDKVMSLSSPLRLPGSDSVIQRLRLLRRLAVDYLILPETMVDAFIGYEPDVLYGNRSHLDLMALELKHRGIESTGLRLVFTGAEVVRASSRRLCREAFGIEPLETYGSAEMGVMAYETNSHDGLHLCEDLTYFEFLDKGGAPVPPGDPGRVVVTDLMGRAMPFIRYGIGDLAVFEDRETSDGRTCRCITRIMGREDDFALLPDGTKRPFHSFYEVMHHYEEIVQFRIVQKTQGLFHILIVSAPSYLLSIQDDLLAQLRRAFPPSVSFEVIPVDRIEPDPSGKIQMLISEIESES